MIQQEETFGEMLKRLRKRRGLSQRGLARDAEVDFSYINKLERGTRSPPGLKVVLKLIDALAPPREAAEQLLLRAGHDPLVLYGADGLAISSPTIVPSGCSSTCDELHAALHRIPVRLRQRYARAFIAFVDTLSAEEMQERREAADARENRES